MKENIINNDEAYLYTDVGKRFRLVFEINFYIGIVMIISVLLNLLLPFKAAKFVTRSLSSMAEFVLAISTLIGLFFRFFHSGKVCSGDYLAEDEPTEGYLTDSGTILLIIFWFWVSLMMLGCCLGICSIFFMMSWMIVFLAERRFYANFQTW